jgi:hypothetical protein
MKNLTLAFFLIGLIANFLFSFLSLISLCSEGNIVDHISAKDKLTWCCLHCCVIGASNSMVSIHLIGGSNQMDDLLLLVGFHDCLSI